LIGDLERKAGVIVFRTISWLSGMMIWWGGILAAIFVFLTSIRSREYLFLVTSGTDSEPKESESRAMGESNFLYPLLCYTLGRPKERFPII